MSNEIQMTAEQIWSDLNSINNYKKPKEWQLAQIERRLQSLLADARKIGRAQVINHIQQELDKLK